MNRLILFKDYKRIFKDVFIIFLFTLSFSTETLEIKSGASLRQWGNGCWGPGSSYNNYNITGNYYHDLKFSTNIPGNRGIWIGLINATENYTLDLTTYDRINFDARNNNSQTIVYLKDISNNITNKISLYQLSAEYKNFTISVNSFLTTGFDMKKVKEILFEPYFNNNSGTNNFIARNIKLISDTFYLKEGADSVPWGNGAWGGTYTFFQITQNFYHQLEFTNSNSGFWIGITPSKNKDLKPYSRLFFQAKANNSEALIFFKDTAGRESSRYKIFNISSDNFTEYEISMNYFLSGNFNIKNVSEILFQAAEPLYNTSQKLVLANIRLDSRQLTTGTLNTLLVDVLNTQQYKNYSPLIGGLNYRKQLQHLWNGYKYRFIDSYKNIVAPNKNLQGLVWDTYTGISPTKIEAADIAKSEGSGYALLMAVYMNDQKTFDEIFRATWLSKMHKNTSTGLFAWNIKTDATFLGNDTNSAIDADQDIAISLILADTLLKKGVWKNTGQNYYGCAQQLINAIYDQGILFGMFLLPSDESGPDGKGFTEVENETNLSYFAPAWYRIFDSYEEIDHDWQAIIDWGYKTINRVNKYKKPIAPDWCDFWGNSLEQKYWFYAYMLGKDAIRVYWRLATDWLWFGEPKARDYLTSTRQLFQGWGGILKPAEIKPLEMNGSLSYLTRGNAFNYTDISYVSMFAAGAMGTTDNVYRSQWKLAYDDYLYLAQNGLDSFLGAKRPGQPEKIDFNTKYNYYNHCLGILSGLMLTGCFPNIYPVNTIITKNIDVSKNLNAYYPFDGDIKDKSGYKRDLKASGTLYYSYPDAVAGKSLKFTKQQYLTTSNFTAGWDKITISLWLKTTAPSENYKLISTALWPPGSGWMLGTQYPEAWAERGVSIRKNSNFRRYTGFVANQWNHLVLSYDRTNFIEYINGEISYAEKLINGPRIGSGTKLMIGAWLPYTAYNYSGLMDEVRIYNKSLTASEVKTLYSLRKPNNISITEENGTQDFYETNSFNVRILVNGKVCAENDFVQSSQPVITLIAGSEEGLIKSCQLSVIKDGFNDQQNIETDEIQIPLEPSITINLQTPCKLDDGRYQISCKLTDGDDRIAYSTSPYFYVQAYQPLIVTGSLSAPNPFNPNTEVAHIGFNVNKNCTIKLYIHSLNRELVYNNTIMASTGYNEFLWDGYDTFHKLVPSGGYYAYLIADDSQEKVKNLIKIAVVRR